MRYQYVDVHCHPNLEGLKENQSDVIAQMKHEGVLGIVVGTNLESSREAFALAQQHEQLWATVGLHPNYTSEKTFDMEAFKELLKEKKVVGVGECGIDYFRQSTSKPDDVVEEGWKEKQWEVFKQHVELAIEFNKPLMVHCRPSKGTNDAYEEVATYLEALKPKIGEKLRGNMHFFVGNVIVARRFWNLGFTTSFTGVLTFTHDYDEVVREAPLDMLLTETDAPWAAPVPHRGKLNQPEYVRYITKTIATLRNEPLEMIQKATLMNAKRMFGVEFEPHIA